MSFELDAFISRAQRAESPFTRLLAQEGLSVAGTSLLRFTPIPFEQVPSCDWIFFYSKKAIRFFFQYFSEKPGDFRWAALGPGTGAVLRQFIPEPDFVGSGRPEEAAAAFAEKAAGQRVLFPAARHSRRTVAKALADFIVPLEMVVYDNRPDDCVKVPAARVLVFTSPLNVSAWAAKNTLLPGQQVVAIGKTTAEALREAGVAAPEVAPKPTEEALAERVMELLGG